jgi:hypothetical protein
MCAAGRITGAAWDGFLLRHAARRRGAAEM